MRKLLALGVIALLSLGANAALAEPGPNGNNDHGLCTAYFNGQKNGHDKDGEGDDSDPKPFEALETEAEDDGSNEDKDTEKPIYADVFEYCNTVPKGIGGNPEENGRYDCRNGEEPDSPPRDTESPGDGEIECYVNGQEPA